MATHPSDDTPHTGRRDVSLIFVTQLFDPADPLLGFVIRWAEALSERCERFIVIANESRVDPHNGLHVLSLGKEDGLGRTRRTLRYLRTLEVLMRRERWSGLLAHMCPDYLSLAIPATKAHRVPAFLWYAHPSHSGRLRVAERLADGILTSLPGSYPGDPKKTYLVGQATDLGAVDRCPPVEPRSPYRLLAIGRTSPSKGFRTIIEAVRIARSRGLEAVLRIVGPSTTEAERTHRRELIAQIGWSGLNGAVSIENGVRHDRVFGLLHSSHALLNAMVAGSGDKVVFEAMAAGRPVLVSNPCFSSTLAGLEPSLLFAEGDAEALATRIASVAALDTQTLTDLGVELRRRVARHHSLDRWADQVISIVREAHHGIRPTRER